MARAPVAELLRTRPSALLLTTQLVLVIAYPFLGGSTAGRAVLGAGQLVAILLAVASVRRTPALTWVAIGLGAPATVFALWEAVTPHSEGVVLASACLHLPFYAYVSYAMLRYLFHDEHVTTDELFATAAAFTVVAWGFAYAYAGVQVLWPGSFGAPQDWYELLFLSFSTLTSVGLADFYPVSEHARSVSILEQVAGVFYVALVVARLIALAGRRAS